MSRTNGLCSGFAFLVALIASLGLSSEARSQGATVFEGARLITGDGSTPIENSAFTVQNGHITGVGRRGELQVPAGTAHVDLTGKTVMPAIVDAHVHMGYRKGRDFGQNNYTRENLTETIERFAYYGVGAILEAGTARSDLVYELRANPPGGA